MLIGHARALDLLGDLTQSIFLLSIPK